MAKVDEFIWRVTPRLEESRELIHQERDVELGVSSLSLANNRDGIVKMIRALIGQDAQCPYSDKLTVVPFSCGSDYVWAIAGGTVDSGEYYSVLLIPIC